MMRKSGLAAAWLIACGLVIGCGGGTPEPKKPEGGDKAAADAKAPAAGDKANATAAPEKPAPEKPAPAKAGPPAEPPAGAAAPKPVEVKMAPIDLSTVDATSPVVIQAPAGAVAKEDFGDISIKRGPGFQLQISSGAKDLAAMKKEIEGNKVNKLKKFHVETADALLYESAVNNRSEFHFLANLTVGDKTYGAEDAKGPHYTQADVELMLRSFKTLALKKK